MIPFWNAIALIATVGICTFLTRSAPFALFGGKREIPGWVKYLGNILPPAIISTLVIYCLKDVRFAVFPFGAAEILSVLAVVVLHVWKRNILLSMAGGTVLYMVLIHTVFA